MSSSQLFAPFPGTLDPDQLCGDVAPNVVTTEWYHPNSYAYHDSYITPFSSTTVESQPWTPYAQARTSAPELHLSTYGGQPPNPDSQHPPIVSHIKDSDRPRSSPSSFGPSAETLSWTTTGLGIHYTTTTSPAIPATSSLQAPVFQNYAIGEHYAATSPPEIGQPQPRKPYPNIAPNPAGAAAKRKRDEEESHDNSSTVSKRRRRTASVVSADLNDEDRFLVQLKEEENLPWKDIAVRFQTDKGKTFQVAALQMRYKRLREKFRVWEDEDVQALKLAHEYWEKYKWEIIGVKMLEFGIAERWPARLCMKKYQDLEIAAVTHIPPAGMTPTSISQFSSPVDGPVHFTFMPLK